MHSRSSGGSTRNTIMTEEELEGWGATDAPQDGYDSEAELDTRKLIIQRRKKKAKSGGFQVRTQ